MLQNLPQAYVKMQDMGRWETNRDFWKTDHTGCKYAGAAGSFWNFGPDTGMRVFGLWK